jgi:two-component system LytT family sensor kinase
MTSLKIKWRQHELLAGALVLGFYVLYLLSRDSDTPSTVIQEVYAAPFHIRKVSFNYFQNLLFPEILRAMTVYGGALYLSGYIIPRLINQKKHVLSVFHLLLFGAIILLGLSFSDYLLNQYMYHGPVAGRRSLLRLFLKNFLFLAKLLSVYTIYCIIREAIIRYVERDDARRDYRVLVTNAMSAVVIGYVTLFIFGAMFRLFQSSQIFIVYQLLLPPAIIIYFICLYKFYPDVAERKMRIFPAIGRLILLLCVVALPFFLLFTIIRSTNKALLFLTACAIVEVSAAVVAWFVYRQQKEKLDRLRGLEAELGTTTAGLLFLRSQINPHFLFNALNTIYGMALQEQADRTAEGVQKLGDMMRFMLHENAKEFISLKKEVDYL